MSSETAFQTKSMKRRNIRNLALNGPARPPPQAASIDKNDVGDALEIGVEFRLDLRSEDLIVLRELGAGNSGTVSKVQHTATKAVMARKVIRVDTKPEVRKQIVRELQIMHECNSPYIVSFFGAFLNEASDVVMCMEYMDSGSLDAISKNFGPVRVDVLGKIAEAVLGGLTYLWRTHRIMHRDIKPSNVLVNSRGQIKLCDFGVSSELEGSVADTFVGTGTYMAPERIQGGQYTVKSDVWSVGLTLMELAIGKFPFHSDTADEAGGPQGILDLLQQIVHEPSPKLPQSEAFPDILHQIVAKCLMKDPNLRPTPQELYESDPFIQASKRTAVDLEAWAISMMERNNRRSHLIAQPPPSETQSGLLLRGNANGAYPSAPALTAVPASVPVPAAGAAAAIPTPLPMAVSVPAAASASSATSAISSAGMAGSTPMGNPATAPVLRTPTTATSTADMFDMQMQALSLDHGSPLNRPYPVRTSSQQTGGSSGQQQSAANGSVLRAPPSGPLPQIPRNGPF